MSSVTEWPKGSEALREPRDLYFPKKERHLISQEFIAKQNFGTLLRCFRKIFGESSNIPQKSENRLRILKNHIFDIFLEILRKFSEDSW